MSRQNNRDRRRGKGRDWRGDRQDRGRDGDGASPNDDETMKSPTFGYGSNNSTLTSTQTTFLIPGTISPG
jgi:hypothetical protein